jgi:transposase
MPSPYSEDLRSRVIAACSSRRGSREETAAQFQISESTLYDWLRRWKQSGSLAPAPHGGGPTSELNKQVLHELAQAEPDATLAEYAERLAERTGRRYSISRLSRALKELGLSRKGRRYAPRSTSSRRSPPSA